MPGKSGILRELVDHVNEVPEGREWLSDDGDVEGEELPAEIVE